MTSLVTVSVALVALLHVGFMLLEMFFWTRPTGRKIFGLRQEFATQTAKLAANQGLYNGFLAAGLLFGLFSKTASDEILIFFLSCIIIAGLYGAYTVSRLILLVQALPALIALILLVYT